MKSRVSTGEVRETVVAGSLPNTFFRTMAGTTTGLSFVKKAFDFGQTDDSERIFRHLERHKDREIKRQSKESEV